jgi:murein DD-endopeptidase MepM/ murein hydrolase activator NlpD
MPSTRLVAAAAAAAVVLTAAPAQGIPGVPIPPAPSAGGSPEPGATDQDPPTMLRLAFPVRGDTSYGSAHHDYPATDVFADCGTRVVSPITGRVLEASRIDRWDPATDKPKHRGGKFVAVAGRGGVRYYGSHLRSLAGGVRPGEQVRAGQKLGRVGRSGNAASTSCHLHFGISPTCRGHDDWWVRRGVVRPYRFLKAWERGDDLNPRRAVLRWKRHHGCRYSDVFG